jgi:glycosyltransferase involved in cell wall biosynthesis
MSAHLGGLLLKMTTGARWVADFRDPWTSMLEWEDSTFRSDLVNRIDRRLERMVVKTADVLVSTAPSVTRYFRTLLSDEQKKKAVTITNGFDSADFEHAASPEADYRKLRICHAGSLYLGRNPEPLFRALSALMAKGAIGREEIEVEFIGNQDYNGRSLSKLVEGYGLSGTVVLTGKMPFDKCFARLMQSQALLLFAQGQPQAIPGKVFEYLRMNKPILAIIDEGDTKDLLRSSHNCFVANPHEIGEIEEKLLKVIDSVRGNGRQEASLDCIEQYERRNLTRKLASLLVAENNHCPSAGAQ